MNDAMNSRWLRWSLTVIAGLLAIIAIELSVFIGPLTPRAQAQIPDSGLQRRQLLELQRETNTKLDRILQHLRTQTVKVQVVGTDKGKETGRIPARKPPVVKK